MGHTVDVQWSKLVMSEDILPVILDNLDILTLKDLLNFRFVNRRWRDAATSVLLKRNACDVSLEMGQVALGTDPKCHTQLLTVSSYVLRNRHSPPPIFRYYNARPSHSLLPDLIRLISALPKFPSNSITFLPGCEHGLKNLSSSPANQNYELEEDELMRLISLWGKNIKKLSFPSQISTSTLQNILFVHLPNLVCLDMRDFEHFEIPQGQIQGEQNQIFQFQPLSVASKSYKNQALKLERIYSGAELIYDKGKTQLLEELIRFSPNIREIHDAGVAALAVLIKMKKSHLITSVNYNPHFNGPFLNLPADRAVMQNFFRPLKLGKLTLHLGNITKYPAEDDRAAKILNGILRESKDTLRNIELHVNPIYFPVNIQIPPMRQLRCLKLVHEFDVSFDNFSTFRLPVGDRQIFQFETEQYNPNRIPPGYFPALSKVLLDVGANSINKYNKLLAFFVLEHCGNGNDRSVITGDILPSVTTLEMTRLPRVDKGLGKLFPNLSCIKIQCSPYNLLSNWVWAAFPKLERFELYDFVPCWETEGHYSFFTGIAHEVCIQFVDSSNIADQLHFCQEQIQFLRSRPYIGDCANLKEFVIQCKAKISSLFIIKLARLYKCQAIAHTGKIIFVLQSIDLSEADTREIQNHSTLVSPHVEIRL